MIPMYLQYAFARITNPYAHEIVRAIEHVPFNHSAASSDRVARWGLGSIVAFMAYSNFGHPVIPG
eukprot:7335979-Karenia_brevis.AAC.1